MILRSSSNSRSSRLLGVLFEKILPFLEKNATHALVVMGEVDYLVTDFMRKAAEGYKDIRNGSPQPSYLRKQQEQQQ